MNTDQTVTAVLEQAGVIVRPQVSFFRGDISFKRSDLGLQDDDEESKQLMQMGKKRLIQKSRYEEINKIESRIRTLVKSCGFPFMDGVGHFIPNARFAGFMEQYDALKAEFYAERDAFTAPEHFQEMIQEAREGWQELAPKLTKEDSYTSPKAARLLEHLENSLPRQDLLFESFKTSLKIFNLAAPSIEGVEGSATTDEHREVVAARQKAVNDARESIQSSVGGFVENCVREMREATSQLAVDMLASMDKAAEKGDAVHQKTLNRLKNFVEYFRSMNFADDQELDAMIDDAEKNLLAHDAAEIRKNPELLPSLKEGLENLRDKANELAKDSIDNVMTKFRRGGRRVILGDDRALQKDEEEAPKSTAPAPAAEEPAPETREDLEPAADEPQAESEVSGEDEAPAAGPGFFTLGGARETEPEEQAA